MNLSVCKIYCGRENTNLLYLQKLVVNKSYTTSVKLSSASRLYGE